MTITENYGDFKVVKCYICNESINVLKNSFNTIQIYSEIEDTYSCRVSDDEIVAYICSKCYNKLENILDGEI